MLGLFTCILLPLLQLLDEGFGLLLVGEGETSGAVLKFEAVEESAILVIGKVVVDLLIPNDTFPGRLQVMYKLAVVFLPGWRENTHRHIDQLQPEGTSHQIICQHSSTLQTGIYPSLRVGIGDIQPGDGYGEDFIRRLRDVSLDSFFVGIA